MIPTPGIAYLASAFDFDLGVVMSASHNPFGDNGIKVFSGRGEKFGEAEERAVEATMADTTWSVAGARDANLLHDHFLDAYIEHVRKILPDAGPLAGARIALDLANGATTSTARTLFERVGFELVTLGDRPDGRNINLECGSTHPAKLAATVVAEHCRLGVAFDGDGDRAIFVDHRGRIVDGDAVLLMLGRHAHQRGRLAGQTVVATVMSNVGLEIALRNHGIKLLRTPVGDKYVMEEMARGGYAIGGEQSGHVILAEHLLTGDGLATALAVLRVMAETGLRAGRSRERAQDAAADARQRACRDRSGPSRTCRRFAAAIARVEAALDGRGRVLVRYSGTEPLLRIMIEGEDQASVQAWAEEIAEAARVHLG